MERKLTEVRQEWVCSQCGSPFDTPDRALDGLMIKEIVYHLKAVREKGFAEHVCPNAS